jgi:hypothetical protein
MDLGACGLMKSGTDTAETKHCEASHVQPATCKKSAIAQRFVRNQLSNAGKRIEIGGAGCQWFNVPC